MHYDDVGTRVVVVAVDVAVDVPGGVVVPWPVVFVLAARLAKFLLRKQRMFNL